MNWTDKVVAFIVGVVSSLASYKFLGDVAQATFIAFVGGAASILGRIMMNSILERRNRKKAQDDNKD